MIYNCFNIINNNIIKIILPVLIMVYITILIKFNIKIINNIYKQIRINNNSYKMIILIPIMIKNKFNIIKK